MVPPTLPPASSLGTVLLPLPLGQLRGGRRGLGQLRHDGELTKGDTMAQFRAGTHHVRDPRGAGDRPHHKPRHGQLADQLGDIDIHTEAAAGGRPLQKTPTVRDTGTIKYQQNFSASLRSYSAVVGPNVPSPVYNGHVEHLTF